MSMRSSKGKGMGFIHIPHGLEVPLSSVVDGLTFGDIENFKSLSEGDQLKVCDKVGSNIIHGLTHAVKTASNDALIDVSGIDPRNKDDLKRLIISLAKEKGGGVMEETIQDAVEAYISSRTDLRESTIAEYQSIAKSQIYNRFGDMPESAIEPVQLYMGMQKDPACKKGADLLRSVVRWKTPTERITLSLPEDVRALDEETISSVRSDAAYLAETIESYLDQQGYAADAIKRISDATVEAVLYEFRLDD